MAVVEDLTMFVVLQALGKFLCCNLNVSLHFPQIPHVTTPHLVLVYTCRHVPVVALTVCATTHSGSESKP